MLQQPVSNRTDTDYKLIYVMRHGTTPVNLYVAKYWGKGYIDPLFWDDSLNKAGIECSQQAAPLAEALEPKPEVLLVSPMTRVLQTAQLAWMDHFKGPVWMEPLAREWCYQASDTGTLASALKHKFSDEPRFNFDHLDQIWWWTAGTNDPKHVSREPADVFHKRVEELRAALLARPEKVIAWVASWGPHKFVTRDQSMKNCQMRTYKLFTDGVLERVLPPAS